MAIPFAKKLGFELEGVDALDGPMIHVVLLQVHDRFGGFGLVDLHQLVDFPGTVNGCFYDIFPQSLIFFRRSSVMQTYVPFRVPFLGLTIEMIEVASHIIQEIIVELQMRKVFLDFKNFA